MRSQTSNACSSAGSLYAYQLEMSFTAGPMSPLLAPRLMPELDHLGRAALPIPGPTDSIPSTRFPERVEACLPPRPHSTRSA